MLIFDWLVRVTTHLWSRGRGRSPESENKERSALNQLCLVVSGQLKSPSIALQRVLIKMKLFFAFPGSLFPLYQHSNTNIKIKPFHFHYMPYLGLRDDTTGSLQFYMQCSQIMAGEVGSML